MKLKLLATLTCLSASLAHASDLPVPPPKPIQLGDSWTYKKTVKTANNSTRSMVNYRITGKNGDKLVYQSLLSDLTARVPSKWRDAGEVDADGCLVDFGGGGALGLQKTCAMSFDQGMDWDTDEMVKGVRTKRRFQVVDTETVTVPAGTFDTVKIKSNWQLIKPTTGTAAKGKPGEYGPSERYQFTYWYSPATKGMVKVVREFYNDVGSVDATVTEELDSYRPSYK